MIQERPEYLAYLLRMWRVQEDGGSHWRASLERPGDGQQLAFPDLEQAFDYPRRHTVETREGLSLPPDE